MVAVIDVAMCAGVSENTDKTTIGFHYQHMARRLLLDSIMRDGKLITTAPPIFPPPQKTSTF